MRWGFLQPNERTVIQSERFVQEANIYVGTRDLDNMMFAIDFALSRYPERGNETSDPRIRAVTTQLRDGIYAIYYTYDDSEVELLSFKALTA